MAYKLFNLIAIATLAILASNQGVTQVNAVSVDHHNFVRHNVAAHGLVAKRQAKTPNRRRCKAPTSSGLASSSAAAAPTSPAGENPGEQAPTPAPQQPAPSPSPEPAPAPAPAPPPSTPSNGGGKVGIAWANPNDNELANWMQGKVSAVYTWSPYKPTILNNYPQIDFIPMLWGPKQIEEFYRWVKPGYARYIAGFNEPDQGGQSNLDVGYAVDLWVQHIQPLKSQGYTLISPACTNSPAGTKWLQDFIGACNNRGCNVDIVATHWYGTSSDAFIQHVESFHNTFNREVWVTEFACQNFGGGAQCDAGQVWNFMQTVTNWMDGQWYVGRYFAFGVLHDMYNVNYANQLMGGGGQPNDLGREYIY
ncbi:glycosyl hydrolase catalytic core-domain-containing protein [Coprinopsis sp. MPI-PUGE-AT-0042]|nr:glycosyl hydrolase catalytic core-domain-containing protein [Coprinopsis sp. MPI-PUGE-AT-0042]